MTQRLTSFVIIRSKQRLLKFSCGKETPFYFRPFKKFFRKKPPIRFFVSFVHDTIYFTHPVIRHFIGYTKYKLKFFNLKSHLFDQAIKSDKLDGAIHIVALEVDQPSGYRQI